MKIKIQIQIQIQILDVSLNLIIPDIQPTLETRRPMYEFDVLPERELDVLRLSETLASAFVESSSDVRGVPINMRCFEVQGKQASAISFSFGT